MKLSQHKAIHAAIGELQSVQTAIETLERRPDVAAYKEFLLKKEIQETKIKELVLEAEESVEAPELGVKFTYSAPFKTLVDYKKALEACGPKNRKLIESISTIDADAYQALILEGKLPNKARLALREEPKKPYVSKRPIKPVS